MREARKTVLSIGAHPDDAEFLCAGSLALLQARGWQVHIASLTPGDCGSVQYSREEISRIRKDEATQSAALLDGQYHCLDCDDIFILYDRPTLLKTIDLVRRVCPTIVFAQSPSDYMVDHEMTSKLAQTACFTGGMVNIDTSGTEPFSPTPYLYYMDPVEGKDNLGNSVQPSTLIDISEVINVKEEMLACHASQRNWLLKHHGIDEYIQTMKAFAAQRGQEGGVAFAEGFRQHLGHAYPRDDILARELGNLFPSETP